MDAGLVLVGALAFAFAFTNGVQDSANSVATLVATRAGRPRPALLVATAAILVGPFVLGSGVADAIAGVVRVPADQTREVVASALVAGLAWNLAAWRRGVPSSSSHALVGGLVGAALAAAGGDAVEWGGLDGNRPVGVLAILLALAVAPVLGAGTAFVVLRALRRLLRRATRRVEAPVVRAQWVASAALSLGQGANDAQKAVGIVAAVLIAEGDLPAGEPPAWAVAGAAIAMAAGTMLGGWRIVRTIGRRIYELKSLDALASQTGSAAVVIGSSISGAPVSSTHIVSSSVVGVGGARRRWGRVRWAVVREIGVAWATTLPATALLAAATLTLWRSIT